MTIDTKRLRDLAQAATPGPWDTVAPANCPPAVVRAGTEQIADAFDATHWTDEQCARNAAFIAASSPTTVLALLDEVDRLRGDEATMKLSRMLGLGDPVRPDIYAVAVRQRDAARQQLAAMTAARDEACEIAKRLAGLECDSGAEDRIAELRKVGAK